MHLDGEINLVLHQFDPCEIQACQNVYRQEEEPEEAEAAGENNFSL